MCNGVGGLEKGGARGSWGREVEVGGLGSGGLGRGVGVGGLGLGKLESGGSRDLGSGVLGWGRGIGVPDRDTNLSTATVFPAADSYSTTRFASNRPRVKSSSR